MKDSRVFIFDLDHTLVKGNSSFGFCLYLIREKVLPMRTLLYACVCYLRHRFFGLGLGALHKKIFTQLLRGRSMPALEVYIEPFVRKYLEKFANFKILSHLRRAQHLGYFTMILSNSPSFLVRQFAKILGVDDWKATEYGLDEEKKLSHVAYILEGEEKASWVRTLIQQLSIDKEEVTVYSDSYLDLPFLLAAGTPVVVNPDKKLRSFSESQQWLIVKD